MQASLRLLRAGIILLLRCLFQPGRRCLNRQSPPAKRQAPAR